MKRYYITDRHHAGGEERLLEHVRRHLAEGVDMIQVREKDLPVRELTRLVNRVLELPNPHCTQILVNNRTDVALACGAAGVHLPGDSISPAALRQITRANFMVGVSCHTPGEVDQAARESADFVVYGPVFLPRSKPAYGPAIGLEALAAVCSRTAVPVYALGGITKENAPDCIAAGASGIAAITLFQ